MSTVSVVVPTRNRCQELLSTIETVLASSHEDLILHIFDNASTDGTRDAVNAIKDERVSYRRSEDTLSITDSFERAFELVETDWVTGAGSDDGYSRTAISEMLRLAGEAGVQAVATERASYHWPSVTESGEGTLFVRHVEKDGVHSSAATIRNVLRGHEKYQALPTAYKSGLVHRSVLKTIRRSHARLFDSWNPDVFLGFAVARATPYFVKSGKPLMISGTSAGSIGWSTLGGGTDTAPGEEYFALSRKGDVPLHPEVGAVDGTLPKHMLVMTLEAYLRSAHSPGIRERVLSNPLVQLGVLLGDSRDVSPEVLEWARRFAEADGNNSLGRARWIAARLLGRRFAYAAQRRHLNSGVAPSKQVSEEYSDQVVVLARGCKGVTVLPGPKTVADAAKILDRGLEADAVRG